MTVRPSHRLLIAGGATLAVLAALTGSSRPTARGVIDAAALARDIEHEDDHVTALELAEWIKDRKSGLRVIDIRSDSEFTAYHVPSAERKTLADLARLTPREGETLVLCSGGGAHAAQGWVLLRSRGFAKVYFLRGGLLEWMDDVMNPSLADSTGNRGADSVRAHVSALSRYFDGVPRIGAPTSTGDSSAAQAVARKRRRGC